MVINNKFFNPGIRAVCSNPGKTGASYLILTDTREPNTPVGLKPIYSPGKFILCESNR